MKTAAGPASRRRGSSGWTGDGRAVPVPDHPRRDPPDPARSAIAATGGSLTWTTCRGCRPRCVLSPGSGPATTEPAATLRLSVTLHTGGPPATPRKVPDDNHDRLPALAGRPPPAPHPPPTGSPRAHAWAGPAPSTSPPTRTAPSGPAAPPPPASTAASPSDTSRPSADFGTGAQPGRVSVQRQPEILGVVLVAATCTTASRCASSRWAAQAEAASDRGWAEQAGPLDRAEDRGHLEPADVAE